MRSEFPIRKNDGVKVHREKKSDGVRVENERKSDGLGIDHV